MADALLSAFLKVVMQKAMDNLLQQFGVKWGIQEKLNQLQRMLSAIQDKLEEAEKWEFKGQGVKIWLKAVKNAAYKADDILDEFEEEAMQQQAKIQGNMMKKVHNYYLRNLVWFHKKGQKLKDIVEKMKELANENIALGLMVTTQQENRPQKENRPQTHPDVTESEVIGRGKEKEKIVKLLLDHDDNHNLAILPIVGMGGLGKTTLAQSIYNDKRVEKHFQPRIWVCVSCEFDFAKLAKTIVAFVTGVECELSTIELLRRRLRAVVRGKRYLLVLDDVWNEEQAKWEELKELLETGGEGSRIIVTTRSQWVSSIMGTLPTHHLLFLTDDDSWTLFRERAFEKGAEVPPTLENIGKEIVKKCGGLPLAVSTLGLLVHSKSKESEWSDMRDIEIWDIQDDRNVILRELRWSYNHLAFQYSKQCFAFCAIFPKDYEIEKDQLIQLWMANGFIPSAGRKELEDKGREIFEELASKSFFKDIKEVKKTGEYITTCKMHGLMHDLARSITRDECLSILDPAKLKDISETTRHLHTSENFQLNIHRTLNSYPNIRTLLSSSRVTANSSKPRSLRALHVHHPHIRRLPISIGYLKHLRYLDLSDTDIEAIPDGTSTLLNLQTLRLSNCCNLSKLPEDLRNLSCLMHLYIDRCHRLKHLPANIGQLRKLRTLTKYIVGNDAGRCITELSGLNLGGFLELYNLRNVRDAAEARHANMGLKQRLHSLILCWDMTQWDPPSCYAESAHHSYKEEVLPVEHAEEVFEFLRPHGNLKLLVIWRYGGCSFPMWMMDCVLQNIVEIHLGVCTGCQHIPPLWKLPFLKFLYMIKMDGIKHICNSTVYGNASNGMVQAFPSLKRLVLHTMQSLEKWSEYEGTVQVMLIFPHLTELKIIECPNLKTMPELPSLKSLEMEGTYEQLGYVCSMTTLSSLSIKVNKTSNDTESPALAQKKESFRYFRSLENLAITASKDLVPLLEEEEETRGLSTSLHYLEIKYCNWFFSPSQQSSSPLAFWKNLSSLLSLEIQFCDDLVSWPEVEFRGLNSLKKLRLKGCKNLVGPPSSPLSSSSSGDGELLPNLEELKIEFCGSLLELPRLPASLRVLYVSSCPKLNSLMKGMQHATALENVVILRCPSLTSLPADLGHLTALTNMHIGGLPGLNCLPQRLGQLAALETLGISRCNRLSSLPEGLQGLMALRHLYIEQCPQLSSLPEGLQQRLSNLQHLVIEGCPNLERQYRRGGLYWNLSHVPYIEIISERSITSTFLPSFHCFRRPSMV